MGGGGEEMEVMVKLEPQVRRFKNASDKVAESFLGSAGRSSCGTTIDTVRLCYRFSVFNVLLKCSH